MVQKDEEGHTKRKEDPEGTINKGLGTPETGCYLSRKNGKTMERQSEDNLSGNIQ